ncbi:MAG: dipeptidase [Candidatus Zixiibacteriota bacterium]|nr:MAG: dipeptidase [candidate division Zixibacteria bacterium]
MSCSQTIDDPEKLHHDALVADMHNDTVLRIVEEDFDISERDTSGHVDLLRLKEGGVDLQVFACYMDPDTAASERKKTIDIMIDSLETQIGRNRDKIAICRTAAEAENIIGSSRIAAFLAIENGLAIENNLENLDHFYNRGVRYMTLTHVKSSDWCISSADTVPAFNGLTDFGREVVKRMNELGMIIDISHASPAAVEEILKASRDPVIASHSCVYALCDHDRNLTDEQIKAIAANGGVIGINFYEGYLSQEFKDLDEAYENEHKAEIDSVEKLYKGTDNWTEEKRKLYAPLTAQVIKLDINTATVVDHIDHIVKLVGPDHVGLGSDYDGVHRIPEGLDDCSMLPNITRELTSRGYSAQDIRKILGENFMRVFRQVCDK